MENPASTNRTPGSSRRVILIAIAFAICRYAVGAAPAVVVEARMPARAYIESFSDWALMHATGKTELKLNVVIPSVYVYDSAGAVVYHGEKVENDVGVLQGLPGNARSLSVSGMNPSLPDLIQMVPDLRARKTAILSSNRYTLVSISGSNSACRKCPAQDSAVSKVKQRASQADINVVEVRLD